MSQTLICYDIYGQPHEASTHELRWRPSAYGIVVQSDRVLMAKQYGKYGLPGGGIDYGEQPIQALEREFYEETGVRVGNARLQSVQSDLFKLPHQKEAGFVQTIQLFYVCDYIAGELSKAGFVDHEEQHAELAEWIELEHLDTIQTYGTPDFIGEIHKALSVAGA